MSVAPRPFLAGLRESVHGGPDYAELRALGIHPDEILDFSVNANPVPPPRELLDSLRSVNVAIYPDRRSTDLRRAAAVTYGVGPEQVLAGNGSSELIWLVCLAYLGPGDEALLRQPTFGEYEVAARIQGANVRRCEDLAQGLSEGQPKLAFLCNPNNPTGDHLPTDTVRGLALDHPTTLLVVDEAYADFTAGRPTLISPQIPDNVVVLRSLTKFAGLAGLRLGLAFAQAPVIANLDLVKPPWSVNVLAQAAGIYALTHAELLPDGNAIRRSRHALAEGLRGLGLQPLSSDCNFFLVPVHDLAAALAVPHKFGESAAAVVRGALLRRARLVRDCTSFGLPDHVRVAVRGERDNGLLVDAFRDLIESGG